MNLSRDFKGVWFPREIWLNKGLSIIEKAVLVEVDSLDQGEEHCFASNDYLSEFIGCSVDTISRAIKKLVSEGFLTMEMSKTREGSQRVLTSCLAVRKIRRPPQQNQETPTPQNAEHSILPALTSSKRTKEQYPQNSHPLILATLLMTEHRTKHDHKFLIGKEGATVQRWAKDIDLLIRKDQRTPDEIRRVILWVQTPGCFWASNILSGAKLREKFPQLLGGMSSRGSAAAPKLSATTFDPQQTGPVERMM